ncbi:unnamed protein product [Paramecium octaurelia]|uniref:Uncharacterized protein n=1 Tax=Paramecium octaurelia TaxID=43137 RepID=A0A8S1WTQ5_PAROT|nr:unnamed protein product [Paramecium octaurelia]
MGLLLQFLNLNILDQSKCLGLLVIRLFLIQNLIAQGDISNLLENSIARNPRILQQQQQCTQFSGSNLEQGD